MATNFLSGELPFPQGNCLSPSGGLDSPYGNFLSPLGGLSSPYGNCYSPKGELKKKEILEASGGADHGIYIDEDLNMAFLLAKTQAGCEKVQFRQQFG